MKSSNYVLLMNLLLQSLYTLLLSIHVISSNDLFNDYEIRPCFSKSFQIIVYEGHFRSNVNGIILAHSMLLGV